MRRLANPTNEEVTGRERFDPSSRPRGLQARRTEDSARGRRLCTAEERRTIPLGLAQTSVIGDVPELGEIPFG